MKKKIALPLLIATAICLPAAEAQAAETIPEVTLNIRPPQDTKLRDGTVIGRGRMVFQEAHSGYLVWLNAQKSTSAPGRYVLTGKRDSAHQLRIRLAGEGWSGENKDRGGIVRSTSATRASFQIVIDGNQQAVADEYVITANALAIVP
ncbi:MULTISPECIES: AfaD family invasin [Kosakonia]|uniref:AfaD family invasin n=1 Tax=Kosakonia TaxID=1330547 RepID=UPI00046180B3|nr:MULTISPECIES: AfaD family invasin [Kosakonia]KDE34022.1 adhesin [Kosakonia radicincitans UMEnt01/12]SET68252.1 AfaD invasin protein [Kosakonia radicincitans]